jgi:hypothetical protein
MVYPGQRAAVKFIEFDFMPGQPPANPDWQEIGDESGDFTPGVTQTLACSPIRNIPAGSTLIFTVNAFTFPLTTPSPTIVGVSDNLGMGNVWKPIFSQLNFLSDSLHPSRDAAYQAFYTVVPAELPISVGFGITVTFGGSCGCYDLHAGSIGVVGALDQVVTHILGSPANSIPIGSIVTSATSVILSFLTYWNPAGGATTPSGSGILVDTPSISGSAIATWDSFGSPPGTYVATWTLGSGAMLMNAGALVSFLLPCTPSNPGLFYALDDPTDNPTWIPLTNFVWDPPVKYGGLGITPPYLPERFYLNQNAEVAIGRRIRMKVDYGSNPCNERDELISWAIFGKKYTEE